MRTSAEEIERLRREITSLRAAWADAFEELKTENEHLRAKLREVSTPANADDTEDHPTV